MIRVFSHIILKTTDRSEVQMIAADTKTALSQPQLGPKRNGRRRFFGSSVSTNHYGPVPQEYTNASFSEIHLG